MSSNLGKTFINSVVREIGRNSGKVASNALFKDTHSTPYRRVNAASNRGRAVAGSSRKSKSNFDKALSFKMDYTPKTLVRKLSGAYIELKGEADIITEDGRVDSVEVSNLIGMVGDMANKMGDVVEVLSLQEEENKEELEVVDKLARAMVELYHSTIGVGLEWAKTQQEHYQDKIDRAQPIDYRTYRGQKGFFAFLSFFGEKSRRRRERQESTVYARHFGRMVSEYQKFKDKVKLRE